MNLKCSLLPLKNMMYRLALRITLNSQEAEDVVQDVIIRIWKERERFDSGEIANLEAYAMRAVRNLALDRQALKVNQSKSLDTLSDGAEAIGGTADSPEQDMLRTERLEGIRRLMAQLPEKQRTAMQLRDFEGRSYKDIAEVMQITEDQVKISIYRARQFLKANISSLE